MVKPPRTRAARVPARVLALAPAEPGTTAPSHGSLAASSDLRLPLPRVMHEANAAVVLVDVETSTVVYANRSALALSGSPALPLPVDEWARCAGLVAGDGRDLADGGRLLSALSAQDAVAGELLLRRVPGTGESAGATEQLWMTGFRLSGPPASGPSGPSGPSANGGSERAIVVPVQPPSPEQAALPPVDERGPDSPQRPTPTTLLAFLAVGDGGPVQEPPEAAALQDRAVIATHLAFTISDPRQEDDPLVWVNPAFTRVTGYEAAEVTGRNCRFLQGPGTDPVAVARLRAALQAQEPVVETLLNYRKDGTAFWNEVSLSPVFDADGVLVNYVGVQSDVTPRILAERAHAVALAAERRARGRLAVLSEVADAMSATDEATALRQATRALVDGLVPWCAVVVADGGLRLAASAGLPDSEVGSTRAEQPPGPSDDPIDGLLRGSGTGIVELDCDPRAHQADGATRWVMERLGRREPGQCAALAIPGRRGVPGVMLFGLLDEVADGSDPEAAEDRALLREAVRRIGLSLENSRLYAREHLVAETLQRSMLPESPTVPGLDVWSYYAPGVEHAQVGGDWYDVLQLDEESVGVVIGDVVGHDIEAAAAMGQLRSVVRAYAFEQQEPGEVLMRVDQLVTGMRIQRSASMVYSRLTREDDGWELSWCRAGHLPPLVVRGREVETLMGAGGPMVGYESGRRVTSSTALGPGDVLVLYTDGLIERRARPLRDGLERLEQICAQLPATDAAGIGEHLLAALGEAPEDDLAIVVVRIPAPVPPADPAASSGVRSRRWQLPGTPASIGRARRLVAQTCRLWGVPERRPAELVVSELVSNAVLHGWGTVGLRLRHEDAVLHIEVDDANPTLPTRVERRDAPGGFGLDVVDDLAEWGWRARASGKTVWARLPQHPPGPPGAGGPHG